MVDNNDWHKLAIWELHFGSRLENNAPSRIDFNLLLHHGKKIALVWGICPFFLSCKASPTKRIALRVRC